MGKLKKAKEIKIMLQAQYWAKFAFLQCLGVTIDYMAVIPVNATYKPNTHELNSLSFKIKGQPNFEYEFDGHELKITNHELKKVFIIWS